MFSWLANRKNQHKMETFESVIEGLKKVYTSKLLPLERCYRFHEFHSPQLHEADFDARPMVVLVGQYSTGKTTFIRYLLERDYPGMSIGPEPTTDKFVVVMHSDRDGIIPGNALVVDPNKQFRPLAKFGNAFLSRFQCSLVNSPVLEGITLVDTPGILSGEKQYLERGYDISGVLEWLSERADRIIVLFDAHKLDISDELRRFIESLKHHHDKIRIVLNKADATDHQQLMRVYGALMWSLGKVLQAPEVPRVYIGSFWERPLQFELYRKLFIAEERDLFLDLQSLPANTTLRKLNELAKRARMAIVHAHVIGKLNKEMPTFFRKESRKKKLIKELDRIYKELQREFDISPGDLTNIDRMRDQLIYEDFSKFRPLKRHLLVEANKMLSEDIARLMSMIPTVERSNAPSDVCSECSFNTGGGLLLPVYRKVEEIGECPQTPSDTTQVAA